MLMVDASSTILLEGIMGGHHRKVGEVVEDALACDGPKKIRAEPEIRCTLHHVQMRHQLQCVWDAICTQHVILRRSLC